MDSLHLVDPTLRPLLEIMPRISLTEDILPAMRRSVTSTPLSGAGGRGRSRARSSASVASVSRTVGHAASRGWSSGSTRCRLVIGRVTG